MGRVEGLIAGAAILVLLGAACAGGGGTPTPSPEVTPPAGETLAFSAGASIYAVAPDGSALREVIPGDRESVWNAAPAFSPDGSHLLFTRDFDLWIATADGQDIRQLADVAQLMTPPGASNPSLGAQNAAWSPDGEYIMYTLGRIGGSGVGQIWLMRPDGSARDKIYTSSAFLLPAWLDGERIGAYEGGGEVRVFRLTGEEESSVLLSGEERPALTATLGPDGRWLVGPFITEGPIMYGPPASLQRVAAGVSPALSPDGRRFAYFRGDTLRVASVDGDDDREVVDLAPLGGRDRHFAEEPGCFPQDLPGCSYRPPTISWTGGAEDETPAAYDALLLSLRLE